MSTRPGSRLSDEYEALHAAVGVRQLERDLVSVEGADAESYLQGQCSQDVVGMEPGSAKESLLLSPQGKIDAVVRLSRTEQDRYVIDTDPGFGRVVMSRLERFRLRLRVEIAPLEGWVCVGLRGPGAPSAVVGPPPLVLPVTWPGMVGVDVLGPAPTDWSEWVGTGAVACGPQAWEAARIEAGLPVAGRDEVAGSIPAETGLLERTVSFTKGCYTGQELVARLDARGSKVARRLCGVVAPPTVPDGAEEPPPIGAAVLTPDGEHEVGRLTSVAWSPGLGAGVGLAMVHRRVAPPAAVVLRPPGTEGAADRPAEARPLPLRS